MENHNAIENSNKTPGDEDGHTCYNKVDQIWNGNGLWWGVVKAKVELCKQVMSFSFNTPDEEADFHIARDETSTRIHQGCYHSTGNQ